MNNKSDWRRQELVEFLADNDPARVVTCVEQVKHQGRVLGEAIVTIPVAMENHHCPAPRCRSTHIARQAGNRRQCLACGLRWLTQADKTESVFGQNYRRTIGRPAMQDWYINDAIARCRRAGVRLP